MIVDAGNSPNVTINEAVEVDKSYGADEAWLFVNGIL